MTYPINFHVTWTRGAVALCGTVTRHMHIPNAPRELSVLVFVQTPHGEVADYPGNMALTDSLTPIQHAALLVERAKLTHGFEYSVERGWEKSAV